jgi:hypothetical protein
VKLQIIQNPSTCSELPLLLAMDSETPEEELLDLLTCHRSVSGLNWSHNGYNNETPVLPFDAHFTDFFLKNTFDCFSPAPSTEDAEGSHGTPPVNVLQRNDITLEMPRLYVRGVLQPP